MSAAPVVVAVHERRELDAGGSEGTSDLVRELESAIAFAYEQTLAAAEHGVARALEEKVAMGQLSFRAEARPDGVVVSIADTDRSEQQLPVGAVALSADGYRSLDAAFHKFRETLARWFPAGETPPPQ